MQDAMQKKIDMAMQSDIVQRSLKNDDRLTAEKTNLLSSASKYAQKTLWGVGAGASNFVGESVDFVGDMALLGGHLTSNAIAHGLGVADQTTLDDKETLEAQQRVLRGMTSIFKSEDAEADPYYNFVKNTTESGLRFATLWKSLAKTGLSTTTKAITAGAGEGFINDPETQEYFNLTQTGLRHGIANMAPDALEDFDALMNPDTDNFLARQSIRRITNAVDSGLIAYGAEKAVQAGGAAIKAIPDEYKKATTGFVNKQLKNARLMVEKVYGKMPDAPNISAKIEIANGVADDVVDIVGGAFDPKKTARENMKSMISVKTDSTGVIADAAHYKTKLASYEKKLMSLAPKIQDEIVSMANVKGVEARAALRDFAQDLGLSEAEFMKKQGLKNVLRTQAHNILVEQEGIKFQLAAKHFKEGVVDEEVYLNQFKSFFVAQSQRAEALTGSARVLRTSQEISAAGKSVLDVFNVTEEKLKSITDVFEKNFTDIEQTKFLADKMSDALGIKNFIGVDDDVFTAAIVKSADGATDLKTVGARLPGVMQVLGDLQDTAGRMTQANLLTGTTTLVQNTFGTAAQQLTEISEAYIRAGMKGQGSAGFREANALFSGTVHGYVMAAKNLVKAMKPQQGGGANLPYSTRYKQLMADIPAFDKNQSRMMMQLDKQELQGFTRSVNPIFDAMNKTFTRRMISGGWSFDAISLQDAGAKGAYAYGKMKQQLARAVYSEDLFGVADGVVDLDTAKALGGRMLANGDMSLKLDDLADLGIRNDAALDIISRTQTWKSGATDEAFEEATRAVFQTELTGGLKATRDFLQDKVPFGRAIVPFFTTPVRILDESLKRMPMIPVGEGGLGLPIHPQIYKQLMAGGTQREEAISKIMFGNVIALLGQRLAEGGYYQPVAPNNDLNAYLSETYGRMPGSVLVDGKSYSTSFLGPVHNLFGIGASRVHQEDIYSRVQHLDEDVEDLYNRTLLYNTMNLSTLVMEQPFATGVEQIAELFGLLETDFTDPTQKRTASERLGRFFGSKIGNLAPSSSLQRQISNNMMDYQMRADGVAEHVLGQFAPYLLENNAYDGYGNKIQPAKGIGARYKNMETTSLEDTLYDESVFVPERKRFNHSYTQPSTTGMRNPPVTVNLGELGIWNEFNARKADGLYQELRNVRNSAEYKENMSIGRIDLNRNLLQSTIRQKEKEVFEGLLLDKPALLDVISQKQKKAIQEKQKGKGFITATPKQIPTFNIDGAN